MEKYKKMYHETEETREDEKMEKVKDIDIAQYYTQH